VTVARARRHVQARRRRPGAVGHRLLDPGSPHTRAVSQHAREDATPCDEVLWHLAAHAHGFTAAISVPRTALRPSTRTQTAATAQSSASGNMPSTKLSVRSLTTPTTLTIRPPPIRLAIALIPARPAASVLAESQLAESAQNGPLKAYAPTRQHVTMTIVGTTAVPVIPNAVKPPAASTSGTAVCQRRSPVLSE